MGGGFILDATSRPSALQEAAQHLQAHLEELSVLVSHRCFAELESYKSGHVPKEESVGTVRRMVNFLIRALRGESQGASQQGSSLHDEIVSFDEGIAARRVKMSIQFEDLIRGLQFMRQEVWTCLQEISARFEASSFFVLERRVNEVFDAYFLGLSSSYRTSQQTMIQEQRKALDKWEEVVKSASEIRLKIPCSNEFAAIVRLQAEAIARRVNFSEEEVYDIITAVGEVCDNSIEHSQSEAGIDVEYSITPEEFRVEVRDYGRGFDPKGKGELPPDVFSEDGRGIFLMRNLMDQVQINSTLGQGTRIVMRKARQS